MTLSQPSPELKVPDVPAAQAYYRDHMGFEVGWYNEDGKIGAVSHGDVAIFFRQSDAAPDPSVFWMFCEDLDAAYDSFTAKGADVLGPPKLEPWGLKQFTLRDAYGNLFYLFHDT